MPNISVCMGVRNGAKFLREQIDSILPQLGVEDELIVSDDHSTDGSSEIAASYNDPRIRVIHSYCHGVVANFETALKASRGRYIFLADQDDIWLPEKVQVSLKYLEKFELVVSDCIIVNEYLDPIQKSFQYNNRSGTGLIKNLIRNSYMGCCMAFHRKVLDHALPFPKNIPVHDVWIGLVSELYCKSSFIPESLVWHRRHFRNASTTSAKTMRPLRNRIMDRLLLAKNVIELKYAR